MLLFGYLQMPDDGDEPLDLSWPSTWRKRLTYVLLAPLIFPMWLLLPDTRRPVSYSSTSRLTISRGRRKWKGSWIK